MQNVLKKEEIWQEISKEKTTEGNTIEAPEEDRQKALVTVEPAVPEKMPYGHKFPENLFAELPLVWGQNGNGYAVMSDAGNPYALPIGSKALNNIIREDALRKGKPLRRKDIEDTNHMLMDLAESKGERMNVWYRVAQIEGGIEIDLGDHRHTRVRITAGKVEVIESGSQTLFYRTPNTLPMALPKGEGQKKTLVKYLNMNPVLQTLLLGWLSYTLATPKVPTSNYLLLALLGGQGTGKSTLSKMLMNIIDPCLVGVQGFPSKGKDLAISLQNAHLRCFDNVRTISAKLSDDLCIAATGGALTDRKLYTDSEEQVIHLHGAFILNGIHSFIEQSDLAQRCLQIDLEKINEKERKTEAQLVEEFQADLPQIMYELFDLIARIFKHLPNAEVTNPERMQEFVKWLAGMERAEGVPAGIYQGVYSSLLDQGQLDTLMENPLAAALVEFAEKLDGRTLTATPAELLEKLEWVTTARTVRSREWPNGPIALSKRLKSLQAGLESQGIEIEFTRGKHRQITIKTKEFSNER